MTASKPWLAMMTSRMQRAFGGGYVRQNDKASAVILRALCSGTVVSYKFTSRPYRWKRIGQGVSRNDESSVGVEKLPLSSLGYVHSLYFYKRLINRMVKDGQAARALQVYRYEMIDADRVKPDLECYITLMKGLAEKGLMEEAHNLFKEMRNRGITDCCSPDHSPIFTSLFGTCLNAGISNENVILNITRIRRFMKKHEVPMHGITRWTLIKAYGKHGHMRLAMNVADEAISSGERSPPEMKLIINALLSCSCYDRKYGLLFAFQILEMSSRMNVKIGRAELNLLLLAMRRCDQRQLFKLTTQLADSMFLRRVFSTEGRLNIPPVPTTSGLLNSPVGRTEHLQQVPPRTDLTKAAEVFQALGSHAASHPLAIFGGLEGLKCLVTQLFVASKPNISTFQLILQLIPINDLDSEGQVEEWMSQSDVSPDIAFANMKLLRAIKCSDHRLIKERIEVIKEQFGGPTLQTFKYLALACEHSNQASRLLTALKNSNLTMDYNIQGILLKNAAELAEQSLAAIDWSEKVESKSIDDALRYFFTVFDQCNRLSFNSVKILNSCLEMMRKYIVEIENKRSDKRNGSDQSAASSIRELLDNCHYLETAIRDKLEFSGSLKPSATRAQPQQLCHGI